MKQIKLNEALQPLEMDSKTFIEGFRMHLSHTLGLTATDVNPLYVFEALALTIRERLVEKWNQTRNSRMQKHRHAYYLSMEYLIGRSLNNAVLNLDIAESVADALKEIALAQEDIQSLEKDAALGNGGLGRLAACFMDSCASLNLPVTGYGIRYEYGMFRQSIVDGYQVENADHWLKNTHIWEIKRYAHTKRVKFGGYTEQIALDDGTIKMCWHSKDDVFAIPYDVPIPGYRNGVVNTLRLWRSEATEDMELEAFNAGNYADAIAEKIAAEKISMVLYPNDATENGKLLRLCQQYFLASASLQDVLHQWVGRHGGEKYKNIADAPKRKHQAFTDQYLFDDFAEHNCFQLNDTHPACAVAELMRLLMDEYHLEWDKAWSITASCMAYTNHTLLPEALEKWPVSLFERLLPRLLEIIYEINARFMGEVAAKWPGDTNKLREMSIIEEGYPKSIRMAHLAIVGSYSVNGVAALHSKLLRENLFNHLYQFDAHKFNNKTNGITIRRWLVAANPHLANLISDAIGQAWLCESEQLEQLKPFIDDNAFKEKWMVIKNDNKKILCQLVKHECEITLLPEAIMDVQVKRIHEYKRQLLNILHAIHLYICIKDNVKEITPRNIIIGGKAAPGYHMAKLIIKLINNVANVVNKDAQCRDLLKIVFIPNYRVTTMEQICPGTDLSEQISTAGNEASGTGNMKFMLNGALTIGTLDGANIEIRDAVGEDNFFSFGLTVDQIESTKQNYAPREIVRQDDNLKAVLNLIECGHFSQLEEGLFKPICESIYHPHDTWMTAADFSSFITTQQYAAKQFRDKDWWARASIINTASSGWFSSDRTIREYNRDIWHLNATSD